MTGMLLTVKWYFLLLGALLTLVSAQELISPRAALANTFIKVMAVGFDGSTLLTFQIESLIGSNVLFTTRGKNEKPVLCVFQRIIVYFVSSLQMERLR